MKRRKFRFSTLTFPGKCLGVGSQVKGTTFVLRLDIPSFFDQGMMYVLYFRIGGYFSQIKT